MAARAGWQRDPQDVSRERWAAVGSGLSPNLLTLCQGLQGWTNSFTQAIATMLLGILTGAFAHVHIPSRLCLVMWKFDQASHRFPSGKMPDVLKPPNLTSHQRLYTMLYQFARCILWGSFDSTRKRLGAFLKKVGRRAEENGLDRLVEVY